MPKIIEVLNELNKNHRKTIALDMKNKVKAKKKGRNYVYKDLSPFVSKFNEEQSIKLGKILSMSEADFVELIILNIDRVKIYE